MNIDHFSGIITSSIDLIIKCDVLFSSIDIYRRRLAHDDLIILLQYNRKLAYRRVK